VASRVWDLVAIVAVLVVAGIWLAGLAPQALAARFQTDECFHAYMSEWIASRGSLPRTIPELYSGFAYYYPPLYHILGAMGHRLFGVDGFKVVNIVVSGGLIAVLFFMSRRLGVPAAGRWAACLCVANVWLSMHAVRMYVEQLTTLLGVTAILLILLVRRSPKTGNAILLGVVVGLALLAKHSSLVIVALVAVLAGFYAVRRESAVARAYGLVAAIGLAIASPMFVRNLIYYGSPIYPALARDLDPLLYQLNKTKFTPAPLTFYKQMANHIGPAIGACVLAAIGISAVRRRWGLEVGLLGFCAALVAAAPLQPLLDPRHMLPVIVSLAALATLIIAEATISRPRITRAIDVVMIVIAVVFMVVMTNFRTYLDQSRETDVVDAAVREFVPEGETVLSLYTYATFYYTRRPATWPIPWGQKEHPVEMLLASDCDSVIAGFRAHRLRYALVSTAFQGETFDGANYPLPFLKCMTQLVDQRRVSVLWHSNTAAIVRIEE